MDSALLSLVSTFYTFALGLVSCFVGFFFSLKRFTALVFVWAVATWLGWCKGFNNWLLKQVVKQAEHIWNQIFNEQDGHFWTLCDWIFDVGIGFVKMFFPNISEYIAPFVATINYAMVFMGRLNQFFPLVEIGVLLGIFWVFVILFLIIKLVLKLIPGIG